MSNKSLDPITPGQATTIGTEIQRHCSRAIACLTKEEADAFRVDRWLDLWTIATLRLRAHGLRVGLYPSDENKGFLHKHLAEASKIPPLKGMITIEENPMHASVLLYSRDFKVDPEWHGLACFFILVEEKPLNPVLHKPPTVFWVKPSDCPQTLTEVLCRFFNMR